MASFGTEFTVDVGELRTLARDLRRVQPELAKELRVGLKKVAEPVRVEASRRAWAASKRIPGTIKVRTSGVNVKIVAGSPAVPTASLFELGNRGRGGGASFRHPVFGHRSVWVSQRTHPFLAPALEARQGQVVEGFVDLVADVLNKVGL